MTLEDKVIEALAPLKSILEDGERITVYITEKCGCQSEIKYYDSVATKKCHLCNNGYIFGAKTFFPK